MGPLHFTGHGHQVLTSWNSDFCGKVETALLGTIHWHNLDRPQVIDVSQGDSDIRWSCIIFIIFQKTQDYCGHNNPKTLLVSQQFGKQQNRCGYLWNFWQQLCILCHLRSKKHSSPCAWCIYRSSAQVAYDPSVVSESNVLGQPDVTLW